LRPSLTQRQRNAVVRTKVKFGDAAAYNLYAIERDGNGWRCEAVTRGVCDGALSETGRRSLSL
jgi:hypothetical protein